MAHKLVNGKQVKLTKAEERALNAEKAAVMEHRAEVRYKQKRANAYPSIGDQLDAILKQLNAMSLNGELLLVPELDIVIEKWLQVKTDFPKPE